MLLHGKPTNPGSKFSMLAYRKQKVFYWILKCCAEVKFLLFASNHTTTHHLPPTHRFTSVNPSTHISIPPVQVCVCVRLVKKPRLSRCICCKVEQHQPEEYLSQVRLGLKQSQHVLAGGMHFEKILFHVPSSFFFKGSYDVLLLKSWTCVKNVLSLMFS